MSTFRSMGPSGKRAVGQHVVEAGRHDRERVDAPGGGELRHLAGGHRQQRRAVVRPVTWNGTVPSVSHRASGKLSKRRSVAKRLAELLPCRRQRLEREDEGLGEVVAGDGGELADVATDVDDHGHRRELAEHRLVLHGGQHAVADGAAVQRVAGRGTDLA